MKIISLADLYNYNYSVNVISGLKQYWRNIKFFSCIGKPKRKHMFLYLKDVDAVYTTKEHKKIYAYSKSIVYCPVDSEYEVNFYNFASPSSCTYGVNVLLEDEFKNEFSISNSIEVFDVNNESYKLLFSKLIHCFDSTIINVGKTKSIMYDIISSLCECEKQNERDKFGLISKGVAYLEDALAPDKSISEVAALCNISETYFRRLFTKEFGISPSEYRLHIKINQAKVYLRYENITISEIAFMLGFVDSAYFSKVFKKLTGTTPTLYRENM